MRHIIAYVDDGSPILTTYGTTRCARQVPLQPTDRTGDIIFVGSSTHSRDEGVACVACFGNATGYYAPFRGNDTMGVASKITEHLIEGQQWPEVKAMSDDNGALTGYNVQFGPDHPPVHLALQTSPGGAGFTIESLLAIALHRLRSLNSEVKSAWNEAAIEKTRRAIDDLHDRTRDRKARGVEGSHAP